MSLGQEVLVWERFLTGQGRAAKVALWTWRKVNTITNHTMLLVTPVWLTMAVVRVAVSTSLMDFMASLCGLLPQYSAGTAAFLLARRTIRLTTLLTNVRTLAEALERPAHPAEDYKVTFRTQSDRATLSPEAMYRGALLVRTLRRVVAAYLPAGMSMLVVQQVLGAPPAPTLGEEVAQAHHLGHALLTLNETAKWGYYAVSYFVLWVLLASVLIALNAMYDELLRCAACARGPAQVRGVAVLYMRLLALQSELKDLTFQPLLHMLAGAFVVPLINTYQMLQGAANLFSFLTFSTLPFVFGSLSALGDGLEVRSVRFADEAYGGVDVFEEPLFASKLRLMLVTRARGQRGQPSGFSMRGFGPLNLHAAFSSLQRWYQYLQLLVGSAN